MKKRKNEEKIPYLLTKKDFKILFLLEEILSKHLKYLNYLYTKKNIPFSIILINASKKSIKETLDKIRNTDIFIEIPNIENNYLILLENTTCENAIKFGSRLTSLINRDFMLNKENISHKIALFCFEKETITIEELCYEILYIIKNMDSFKAYDYWVYMKKF